MSLEELVKIFVALASKSSLAKSEQEEARQLMKQLKEAGMTNENISKLSEGKWTPSTIKFYTPGIKPAHPTPWDDVVAVLDTLIAVDFTLNDVETAVKVAEKLKSHSVSLDSIIGLLFAADLSSLEVPDLVHHYELFEEYGLSPKKISEALGLKEELEKKGLGLDSLQPLLELAESYGNPEKIIQALSQYKALVDLDHQISLTKEDLDRLEKMLAQTQEQVEAAEAMLSQLKELIEAYEKVKQLGFGVVELNKLSDLGQKHGNAKKLMDAVNAYDTYSDIRDTVNKAKSDLAALKANIERLQADHAHIKTGITMCLILITEYNFGLDAISTILSAAKKYGDPVTVFKAIEAYGKLEAIMEENNKQQGIASGIQQEIARLDGKHEETLKKLESLNALALKVGNEIGKIQGEMAASDEVKKLLELINDPYSAEYSNHIRAAMLVALSLRNWVIKNEIKFKNCDRIKSGLEYLVKELGGLP